MVYVVFDSTLSENAIVRLSLKTDRVFALQLKVVSPVNPNTLLYPSVGPVEYGSREKARSLRLSFQIRALQNICGHNVKYALKESCLIFH